MTTTALTIRDELATSITTAFADASVANPQLGPVVVYPYPAEVISLPAVVFVPDEPYWVPARFKDATSPSTRLRVNFELQLLVPRTELEEAQKLLELMATTTIFGLFSAPVARWDNLGQPSEVDVGDIPVLMAPVSCHAII